MPSIRSRCTLLIALVLSCPLANAQWNPPAAQWGKTDPRDVRVMTWNVRDTICSTNNKQTGSNDWTACASIVAAMNPDILLLQECGDNSGNGTGSSVDTVANLTTTLNLFINGGIDTFKPGNPAVTAYVKLYAPSASLPYVFVSDLTDAFNRNVILSRYPFADLNGDTLSKYSDIPRIRNGGARYAPGTNGGIRGFMLAELDLPDVDFGGDLVVGCAHLRSGSAASDLQERLDAGKNVAYVLDYWYNGGGLGVVDPYGAIGDVPPATALLPADTPFILGGDWNEDELTNGRRGPATWLTEAEFAQVTAPDGTDRDRSDSTYDSSVEYFGGSRNTVSSAKFDYVAWQDSIAVLRRSFVFNSSPTPIASMPPEVRFNYPSPSSASSTASDHRPVIADFILPVAPPPPCPGDADGDRDVDQDDMDQVLFNFGTPQPAGTNGDVDGSGFVDQDDLDQVLFYFGAVCP